MAVSGRGSPEASLPIEQVTAEHGATPSPVARTESKTPFKEVRRRRSRITAAKVSMFGLRDLWLMPFLAEIVLFLGAAWMTFCLQRVVQDPKAGFPLSSVLVLAAAYCGLAIHSRLHELFLPRKVVLLGVGTLLVLAAGISFAVFLDAYLLGGRDRLMHAALVLTPVHLFVLRCLLVFRDARFAPSAASLSLRLKCKGERFEELRQKLRFWMS